MYNPEIDGYTMEDIRARIKKDFRESFAAISKDMNQILMLILTMSLILGTPAILFLINKDFEKPNALEILRHKNPAGYERFMDDHEDLNNTGFADIGEIDSDYFVTPIIYLSAFCLIPLIAIVVGLLLMPIYFIKLLSMLPAWLASIVKFIMSFYAIIGLIFGLMYLSNRNKTKNKEEEVVDNKSIQ